MEESKTHIPLVTRLDHLDFLMKSLEAKQELSKFGEERVQPMISLDMAAREAYFRGSLMDRVAFLERRLFQLCFEMESSSRSSGPGSGSGSGSGTNSSGTESLSSSTQGLKSNINLNHAYNLQDYLPPNHIIPQQITKERIQKEGGKDSKEKEQKAGKTNNKKGNGEENKSKSGRKRTPPKWPHIKILGC